MHPIGPSCSSCATHILHLQEDDVIGVLNSKDIAQLLPIGDRILIQVSQIGFRLRLLHCTSSRCNLSSVCLSLLFPVEWWGMQDLPVKQMQVEEAEAQTSGGLLMASSSSEKPTLGKVTLAQLNMHAKTTAY